MLQHHPTDNRVNYTEQFPKMKVIMAWYDQISQYQGQGVRLLAAGRRAGQITYLIHFCLDKGSRFVCNFLEAHNRRVWYMLFKKN